MIENKGDLISREALKKDIEHLYSVYAENKERFYTDVLDHIDNAPTVNFIVNMKDVTAEEKQHFFNVWRNSSFKIINDRPQGEWIPNYTPSYLNPAKRCSLCGKVVEFSENYCPKCGARMEIKT